MVMIKSKPIRNKHKYIVGDKSDVYAMKSAQLFLDKEKDWFSSTLFLSIGLGKKLRDVHEVYYPNTLPPYSSKKILNKFLLMETLCRNNDLYRVTMKLSYYRDLALHFGLFWESIPSLLFIPVLELMEFLDRVVKGSKTKLCEFRLSDKAKRNLSKANVPDISGAFESLRVANMIKNGVLQDSEMISRMIAYGENREKEHLEAGILMQGVVLEELLRLLVDDETCILSPDFLIMRSYIDRLVEEKRVRKDSDDYSVMEDIRRNRNLLVHYKSCTLAKVKRNGEWLMDSINRIGTANRDYTKVRFPLDTYLTI